MALDLVSPRVVQQRKREADLPLLCAVLPLVAPHAAFQPCVSEGRRDDQGMLAGAACPRRSATFARKILEVML